MTNRALLSHTHCKAAQAHAQTKAWQRVCYVPTLGRKESTGIQHCIRAIAFEVVNQMSVHLINLSGGGQVIATKSATALILERYRTAENPWLVD